MRKEADCERGGGAKKNKEYEGKGVRERGSLDYERERVYCGAPSQPFVVASHEKGTGRGGIDGGRDGEGRGRMK